MEIVFVGIYIVENTMKRESDRRGRMELVRYFYSNFSIFSDLRTLMSPKKLGMYEHFTTRLPFKEYTREDRQIRQTQKKKNTT